MWHWSIRNGVRTSYEIGMEKSVTRWAKLRVATSLLFSFDCFNLSLGIPLNVYVLLVILFLNKKLCKLPHYIIQLNAMLCNYLTLLNDGIEAAYYFNPGNDQLCHSFVYTMSIAPNAFIFNVFLSVVNQLLTITKPQWHSTNVTPRRVVFWSLILNSFLIVLLDRVYVFGVEQVRCAYQKHHILALGITYYTLFASSAFLIWTIRAKTRPDQTDNNPNNSPNAIDTENGETDSIINAVQDSFGINKGKRIGPQVGQRSHSRPFTSDCGYDN